MHFLWLTFNYNAILKSKESSCNSPWPTPAQKVEEWLQSVAFETNDTGHTCRTDNIGGGNPFEAIVFPYIRED